MRYVGVRSSLAVAALVVAGALGCSDSEPISVTTKITYDGQTYVFDSDVSCVRQSDGGLIIDAPSTRRRPGGTLVPGRGMKLIRVELLEEPRILVESAAFRFDDVRGFTDDAEEMWGTKVDDVYTISGRMPDDNSAQWHQFQIVATCPNVSERFGTVDQ